MVTPNLDAIILEIDPIDGGADTREPVITLTENVVSETDGDHFINITGNAQDATGVDNLVFQVMSDYQAELVFVGDDNISPDGSFSLTHKFDDVVNQETVFVNSIYAIDDLGNGLTSRIGPYNYLPFEISVASPSFTQATPASFLYLDLGQEINQTLTNEMFGLSDDVSNKLRYPTCRLDGRWQWCWMAFSKFIDW